MSKVKVMSKTKGEMCKIFIYPNFHISGSIKGMRKIYGKNALLVRWGSYIYNVPPQIYDLADDKISDRSY